MQIVLHHVLHALLHDSLSSQTKTRPLLPLNAAAAASTQLNVRVSNGVVRVHGMSLLDNLEQALQARLGLQNWLVADMTQTGANDSAASQLHVAGPSKGQASLFESVLFSLTKCAALGLPKQLANCPGQTL